MRAISIIFRRELSANFKSPFGWGVSAAMLFVMGILFYTKGIGAGAKLSADVVRDFFNWSSGPAVVAALLLSMRLIAQERQTGSLVLLSTSPVRESDVVIGKFLAVLAFLAIMIGLSFYLPLLVLVRGKVSFAQVFVGYSGLMLLAAAVLAIGVFATAIANDQITAGVIAAVLAMLMSFGFYYLSRTMDAPLRGILESLALYHKNYWPFTRGILHLKHVLYHFAVVYFFLLLAVKSMEARRWR